MSALLDFVKFNELSNWSVAHLLQNHFNYNKDFELVKIGSFLKRNKTQVIVDDNTTYKRVTIKLYNNGVFLRDTEIGKNIGTKKQFSIKEGQFLLSKIDARNGAFGIATNEVDGAIITADFLAFDIDKSRINPDFLVLITTTKKFMQFAQSASSGTTGRQRIDESKFLNTKIPLPKLDIQKQIVENYQNKINLANEQGQKAENLEKDIEEYLYSKLGLEKDNNSKSNNLLNFISFEKLMVWSCKDILDNLSINSIHFKTYSLNQKPSLFVDIFRGKSPKYEDNSKSIILNQKCNRWNDLELEHSKSVNDEWFEKLDKKFFTQEGDILINSTGDGTIGRATCISKEFKNLIYDSHILLLRVNQNEINPLFLTYFINCDLGQKQIENIKSAVATKQTELGINNLKNLQFIIPDIDIQNEIANTIKEMKNQIKFLNTESKNNKQLSLEEFEKEVFNEA
ncbi:MULTISPECIES: restriction endonuclease subunit S [Aliarcobacter]|uniref:Restriction endonuclease subunit S n=2 Tax=Aliarcobacter butzleri TaxID=28197 RepID=A0AAW6VE63_9BACT|nr:restriction endonuclease subunit S [Aliarcobacter butzleri]KLD96386.1 hypothetical protein AA20_12040 [Aliarcobacter butzleri L348]MDK2040457.1 restriction endonuclease subunit S [Aliarcobacter butzleri]MDK2096013.1 restriction endonuclease subunit S [Aliarcobacter butzleri]MDN5101600.1 restriction endonuclease subunit S [Aliarcobacter butzleri]MDN5103839.1 restriction endonuclease subunit S [Aliarcobacter butzleri]